MEGSHPPPKQTEVEGCVQYQVRHFLLRWNSTNLLAMQCS
jgi:hypothetical protein